jgi:Cytosol aminopeptidase family, N-terminal domain
MNRLRLASLATVLLGLVAASAIAATPTKTFKAPHDQTISVEEIGPVTQTTDLQILCILKHDPAGDKYIEAMNDFNTKLHGLFSGIRDSGEFDGDFGQTLLFVPPADSITPRMVLLIGVGDETKLTIEKLQRVGEIAAAESARLKAANVSFAPTLRDQGSSRIDVGDGDAAFATGWILAYDTEKKLEDQGLAPSFSVSTLTFEAGPKFFDGAASKVEDAIKNTTTTVQQRSTAPYVAK